MAEALTATAEVALLLALALKDRTVFKIEAVGVIAVEVAMVVEEVVVEEEVAVTTIPMKEECMEDMIKSTRWMPTMSMILRLPTKILPTRVLPHIQITIRVMGNMKVR